MTTLTFKQWLKTQRHREDPVGHFAADASLTSAYETEPWPRGATTLQRLHDYLNACNAMPEAHTALDRAWTEWQAEQTLNA